MLKTLLAVMCSCVIVSSSCANIVVANDPEPVSKGSYGFSPFLSGVYVPSGFLPTRYVPNLVSRTGVLEMKRAVELAKQGQVQQGLALARETNERIGDNVEFSLLYIDTLVKLAGEKGSTYDREILNEGIRAANRVYSLECGDGSTDSEMAYRFMVSLGRLGDAVRELNPKIGAQLYHVEGRIAENVLSNGPINDGGRSGLAEFLMDAAIGKSIAGESAEAYELAERAFQLSRYDFVRVKGDEYLADVPGIEWVQPELDLIGPLVVIAPETNEVAGGTVDGEMAKSGATSDTKSPVMAKAAAKRKPLTATQAWARDSVQRFRSFPFSFDVANAAGGRLKDQDYQGKLVLVDVWATWCPPCRQTIPHLIQLQKNYGGEHFQVVGLSADNLDSPETGRGAVDSMMKNKKANYPSGLVGHATLRQVNGGDMLLPTLLFMDGEGTVRFSISGYHSYEQLEALTQYLLDEG